MTVYPASKPPSGNSSPLPAWTKDTVKVTDGSERQLGKDAFLLLLLTQLQNQDPTNPMENTEMTAQLAQFSQLEQLTNMSNSIDTLTGYIQAQNQFQTLTMIGKEVLAENDQLSVTGGKTDVDGSLIVTESCDITVYVLNSRGESVRTIKLGQVDSGTHNLNWDGQNSKGEVVPDGAYKFQVTAINARGEILSDGVYPQVSGKITSVSFDATGQPVIHMGNASLALGQVVKILESGTLTGQNKPDENSGGED
ncbi:MAG: flagellar hook assembly protein FlgD [Candidatus Adiutrix sp.]